MSADRIDVLADLRDYADAKAAAYLRALHALPAKGANAEQLAKVAKLKAAADAAASTRAAAAALIEAARVVASNAHMTAPEDAYHEVSRADMDALIDAIARVGGAP